MEAVYVVGPINYLEVKFMGLLQVKSSIKEKLWKFTTKCHFIKEGTISLDEELGQKINQENPMLNHIDNISYIHKV